MVFLTALNAYVRLRGMCLARTIADLFCGLILCFLFYALAFCLYISEVLLGIYLFRRIVGSNIFGVLLALETCCCTLLERTNLIVRLRLPCAHCSTFVAPVKGGI